MERIGRHGVTGLFCGLTSFRQGSSHPEAQEPSGMSPGERSQYGRCRGTGPAFPHASLCRGGRAVTTRRSEGHGNEMGIAGSQQLRDAQHVQSTGPASFLQDSQ